MTYTGYITYTVLLSTGTLANFSFHSSLKWNENKPHVHCQMKYPLNPFIYLYWKNQVIILAGHIPVETLFFCFCRADGKCVTCLQPLQEGQCPGFVAVWRDSGVRDCHVPMTTMMRFMNYQQQPEQLCSVFSLAHHPAPSPEAPCGRNLPGSHGAASVRT